MANNSERGSGSTEAIYRKLGANERAIVDKVSNPFLRKLFINVIGFKLRLQFTGWLQFLLPLPLTLLLLLVGGIAWLLHITLLAKIFAYAGGFMLFMIAFDIITVKFRIRPPEPLPKRKDQLDRFDLMRSRHSCRSYQSRNLTDKDRAELLASVERHTTEAKLSHAPVRFEYIAAPLTVWPTVNGHEFLVAIAPKQYDRLAVMDVGRSLQKVVIDATRMGLGTCWIGPGADHNSVVHHLGERFNPEQDNIICVCAVGYESWFKPMFIRLFNRQMHHRRTLDKLFYSDAAMQQALNIEEEPFKQFGRTYEVCQWSPSSYNGQTTRCVAVTGDKGLERFDFYAVTASRYYAAVATGIWCANWEMGCEALGIKGHFAVRNSEEKEQHQLPKYDISWVLE